MKKGIEWTMICLMVMMGLYACGRGNGGSTSSTPQPSSVVLFVANESDGSISVVDSSGNLLHKVLTNISGKIVADTVNNELFAVANVSSTVDVFAINAGGDLQMLRTISGFMPGYVGAISVDANNNELLLIAAQSRWGGTTIYAYERTATGNATPLRYFYPGLQFANTLIVDPTLGEIFVAASSRQETPVNPEIAASINVYSRTATGSASPLRTISGDAAGLKQPVAMALDTTNNEIFIADAGNNSITVHSRNANGNTVPMRMISGEATGLSQPRGIVIDTENDMIFVANYSNDSITVYPKKANGNISPLKTFSGHSADLHGPSSMALAFQ